MKTELQQTLYNDIKIEGEKLSGLSSYVQNDFERMLEDAFTTPAAIRNDLDVLINAMNGSIFKIRTLQDRVRKFKENFN